MFAQVGGSVSGMIYEKRFLYEYLLMITLIIHKKI